MPFVSSFLSVHLSERTSLSRPLTCSSSPYHLKQHTRIHCTVAAYVVSVLPLPSLLPSPFHYPSLTPFSKERKGEREREREKDREERERGGEGRTSREIRERRGGRVERDPETAISLEANESGGIDTWRCARKEERKMLSLRTGTVFVRCPSSSSARKNIYLTEYNLA